MASSASAFKGRSVPLAMLYQLLRRLPDLSAAMLKLLPAVAAATTTTTTTATTTPPAAAADRHHHHHRHHTSNSNYYCCDMLRPMCRVAGSWSASSPFDARQMPRLRKASGREGSISTSLLTGGIVVSLNRKSARPSPGSSYAVFIIMMMKMMAIIAGGYYGLILLVLWGFGLWGLHLRASGLAEPETNFCDAPLSYLSQPFFEPRLCSDSAGKPATPVLRTRRRP